MNICLIVTGLGMGGAERQVCDLADQFFLHGHNVMIISLTGDAINLPNEESVKIINLQAKKNIFSLVNAFYKVRKILIEFKPDVVHSHMVHANIFSRIIRLTLQLPRLISTAHNTNEGGRGRMFLYRITDHLADISTNVSEDAVRSFINQRASKPSRMRVVHNGIDIDKFHYDALLRAEKRAEIGLSFDTPLLLSVGRLTEAKDYPNLLNAFAQVLHKMPSVHIVVIGIGGLYNSLNKLADELGISDKVHWLGLRHDVRGWMSAADLYVMSSEWEGMPLVICEAMSSQRVVVATDCGGVKEVVNDSGFIVPPKDFLLLSKGILEALTLSKEEKLNLELKARKRIMTNYSLDAIAKTWLDIYSTPI